MIAFTDVQYTDTTGHAACVLVDDWAAATAARTVTAELSPIAPYEPGAFYKRELPCLLEVLRRANTPLTHVVIDGYVWLDDAGAPGLGAHLYEALHSATPVIGLAKTAFKGSAMAAKLERPGSVKPLFVTAAGVALPTALSLAQKLHGPWRIPTLLADVDRLARKR